ncbi:MAG: DUF4097 family beta strand repeat protein [Algoriphagus sp.]|uniref:DUF4097 family beta strand repeat-containing protein n=1 Tax=Algoriphagus sp. TaxID=1872435 RepID=UPI0018159374|nr:DUF4097 family beta strand repeat-containing protein [Algoriphagus sp.]NVJ85801.1 DUF4097 family beta strand repeat protein [Algoriphagus sp.]
MKTTLKTLTLGLSFIFLATIAFAQNVLVDVNKSYPGINRLEVEGGWLDVSYEGGSGADVQVEAYLASNDEDQDIVFVTVGDVLKIKYERKSRNMTWSNSQNKGFIKIKGPESIEITFRNSSGNTTVRNVASEETYMKVTSGRITAEGIDGDLTIGATSGRLIVSDVAGNVTASLTSGNGEINQVSGDVDYKSTSGSLDASQIDGELSVEFTSGRAVLENIGQLGTLKFTSGSIRAEEVGLGPNTSFSGSSGNFRIQTYSDLSDFNFNLSSSSGNLTVGDRRSSKNLEIDNGSDTWIKGRITSGSISIEN